MLSYSQQVKDSIQVIFIRDLGAKDYYTLLDSKKEELKFELIEACIPKGLLAIKYEKGYSEDELRSYMQSIILKLIDKTASPTSYTLEDLRQACTSYREGLD